jgi:hypothetical protein
MELDFNGIYIRKDKLMSRIFKIIPDGVSYNTVYDNVSLNCISCGIEVNRVSYSERTGMGEWTCSNMHLSREKIGSERSESEHDNANKLKKNGARF